MIHRTGHEEFYVIITNCVFKNKTLSLSARGLLGFLLTFSDDWEFSFENIVEQSGATRYEVRRTIRELQDLGFVKVVQRKSEKGKFSSCSYDVFENPCVEIPHTVLPHTEKPHTENPHTDFRTLNNNNNINNNKLNNNKDKENYTKESFHKPTFEEVEAYCQERQNGIDAEQFIDYYESKGWMIGKNKMKDWKASVRTWERNRKNKPKAIKPNPVPEVNPFTQMLKEEGYSI